MTVYTWIFADGSSCGHDHRTPATANACHEIGACPQHRTQRRTLTAWTVERDARGFLRPVTPQTVVACAFCPRPGTRTCDQCDRPVCADHGDTHPVPHTPDDALHLCVACQEVATICP